MIEKLKTSAVNKLHLASDVILKDPLISCVGCRHVIIENYRKISLYSDSKIELIAQHCKIIIIGKNLSIEYYSNDDMRVTGSIQTICFDY